MTRRCSVSSIWSIRSWTPRIATCILINPTKVSKQLAKERHKCRFSVRSLPRSSTWQTNLLRRSLADQRHTNGQGSEHGRVSLGLHPFKGPSKAPSKALKTPSMLVVPLPMHKSDTEKTGSPHAFPPKISSCFRLSCQLACRQRHSLLATALLPSWGRASPQ